MPLEAAEDDLIINRAARCACVLLLDTSSSMDGAPIRDLSEGVGIFKEETAANKKAAEAVEVAVITFDSNVKLVQDFVSVSQFDPPELKAAGLTSMGAGIIRALEAIKNRKQQYKEKGLRYYRPWLLLLTDGRPTDQEELARATQSVQQEQRSFLHFYAFGVEGADLATLKSLTDNAYDLRGFSYGALFRWISESQIAVSCSNPGGQIALPPPPGTPILITT
jgi:uncharacterized protein YegL